jgi:hypothetical protein
MSLNITKGPRKSAVRAVIYGVEGVGKSSLAAMLPEPLFLDLEEGTHQLDVARSSVDTFAGLQSALAQLAVNTDGYKTIVIDSADWCERLAAEALLKKQGKKSIEDFGFGKGHIMLAEELARTLAACDTLISHGVNVVWVAHAKTVKVSPPDMVDGFDRYELKLHKQTAPLFKEWADLLLFANYETTTVKGNDGRVKGDGGKRRVLISERAAAWDAKNRYGLPEIMPMIHNELPPELAAIFAGKITPRAAAPVAAFEPAPVSVPVALATPQQIATFTTYGKNSVGAKLIEAALAHYGEISPADLTADQAAKVITRCQEEMNKPAAPAAKPTGPLATAAAPFVWSAGFADWMAANEDVVNTFLIGKFWLNAGQTWRDLSAEHAESLIQREAAFAASAKIPARGGVA